MWWLAACSPAPEAVHETASDTAAPSGTPWVWDLPPGLPAPAVPDDNPMTVEKVELGRWLFHDVRLSGNGELACAGCHVQELAWSDGRALPEGSTGQIGVRNAPGLTDVAYHSVTTWANPLLLTFEEQIPVPLFGERPVEMGIVGHEDEVLGRLSADPDYVARFAAAFPELPPDERIDWGPITSALASFVRAIVSFRTPYDDYVYRGQGDALTDAQRRGLDLFLSERLECSHCHGGVIFSNAFAHAASGVSERPMHNTGLYNLGGTGAYPATDRGLYDFTAIDADMGKFRPPGLRNLAYTAPYLHDGSAATLDEVIRIYERGGRLIEDGADAGDGALSPYKSGFVSGFTLTDQERADLLDFLTNGLADDALRADPALSDPFAE